MRSMQQRWSSPGVLNNNNSRPLLLLRAWLDQSERVVVAHLEVFVAQHAHELGRDGWQGHEPVETLQQLIVCSAQDDVVCFVGVPLAIVHVIACHKLWPSAPVDRRVEHEPPLHGEVEVR